MRSAGRPKANRPSEIQGVLGWNKVKEATCKNNMHKQHAKTGASNQFTISLLLFYMGSWHRSQLLRAKRSLPPPIKYLPQVDGYCYPSGVHEITVINRHVINHVGGAYHPLSPCTILLELAPLAPEKLELASEHFRTEKQALTARNGHWMMLSVSSYTPGGSRNLVFQYITMDNFLLMDCCCQ